MKYYIDITLLPDAEANIGFLWEKVFQQVHLALVEKKNPHGKSGIAVSFPGYGNKGFPLGNKLRLLAPTQEQLQQLDIAIWLNRLTDYCHHTSIKDVPQNVGAFSLFKRVQFNTNIERLARRRAKYKGETFEEALKHFNGFKDKESKLPYINLASSPKDANGNKKHKFRLFVDRVMLDKPQAGEFNCYGLSKTATVPWF